MRVNSTLFLAFVFAFPLTLPAPLAYAQSAAVQIAQITVTGEGRVDVAPDMAVITLGVTREGRTAAEAMAGNSAQLAQVLANLKAAGIADRDLQTSGLSLNPNWNHNSSTGAPRIQGYVASNQLSVRVRALETLGAVLDAAVKDGANTLNGVRFAITDPAPLLDEARKRAVADARHKAELLSEAAGVSLGRVLLISESGGAGGPQPQFRMAESMVPDAVPVAEGEVSLSASVSLTWELGQ
jgi:uncharacterized protein YggE